MALPPIYWVTIIIIKGQVRPWPAHRPGGVPPPDARGRPPHLRPASRHLPQHGRAHTGEWQNRILFRQKAEHRLRVISTPLQDAVSCIQIFTFTWFSEWFMPIRRFEICLFVCCTWFILPKQFTWLYYMKIVQYIQRGKIAMVNCFSAPELS